LKSRYGDAYVFVLLNINAKAQVKKDWYLNQRLNRPGFSGDMFS
jgi:hypothetical protein